jgi:hypothetical protein
LIANRLRPSYATCAEQQQGQYCNRSTSGGHA